MTNKRAPFVLLEVVSFSPSLGSSVISVFKTTAKEREESVQGSKRRGEPKNLKEDKHLGEFPAA